MEKISESFDMADVRWYQFEIIIVIICIINNFNQTKKEVKVSLVHGFIYGLIRLLQNEG